MTSCLIALVFISIAIAIHVMYFSKRPLLKRYRFTHTIINNTIKSITKGIIMLEFQNDQFVPVQSGITDDDGQPVTMSNFSVISADESVATIGDITQLEDGRMQYNVIGTQGMVGATTILETATTPDGQEVTSEYAVSTLPNPVGFVRTFGEPQNQ